MIDKDLLKSFVAKVQGMDYGEMITHGELAEALQVVPATNAYYSAMSKVKKACLGM